MSVSGLLAECEKRGWSEHYRSATARLICDRRIGGCGARPKVGYMQPPSPHVGGLVRVLLAPRGIDAVAWDMADERERKRMVQRVRG